MTLYVPILATDPGRLQGLALTHDAVRARLTPLLDVTPAPVGDRDPAARARQLAEHLDGVVAAVAAAVGPQTALVDAGDAGTERGGDCARTADGRVHLAYLLDRARARRLALIPVTGLRRPAAYQLAVADAAGTDGRGVALRVGRPDFRDPRALAPRALDLLAMLGTAPDATDLVVDVGGVTAGHLAACEAAARAVLTALTRDATWRSVTIAAATQLGAVPPGAARGPRVVPRTDWLLWRALTGAGREAPADVAPLLAGYAERGALRFGDYGPLLYGPHPVRPDGTAEWVGYAQGAEWLVPDLGGGAAAPSRATGRSGGAPVALRVVREGHVREGHVGRGSGHRRTGRVAAVSHHLTVAVEQLALDPTDPEPMAGAPCTAGAPAVGTPRTFAAPNAAALD